MDTWETRQHWTPSTSCMVSAPNFVTVTLRWYLWLQLHTAGDDFDWLRTARTTLRTDTLDSSWITLTGSDTGRNEVDEVTRKHPKRHASQKHACRRQTRECMQRQASQRQTKDISRNMQATHKSGNYSRGTPVTDKEQIS